MTRVAVIHDWLTGMRGGEAVLEAILDALPEAELFTLIHYPGTVSKKIESRTIHTSSVQTLATRASDYRQLLPLFPRAVRQWDFSRFDLIVSSSHCVAKGVDAKGKPHLSYCHTPMRYIWDRFDDYFPRSKPLRRAAMMSMAPWLRRWDVKTSEGVTRFIANSAFVRDRIRRYYDRDAQIVHPYVDDAFLAAPLLHDREDYHLIVSALVPYKRIDLAVAAAVASGKRLVVIGGGPLLDELRTRGGTNVEFLGAVSREMIIDRLSRARSLILPGVEDFGITPLEAMALGTPVVALGEGGVRDSVVSGSTGIFFEHPEVDSLRGALEEVEARPWDRETIRARAVQFSRATFDARFREQLANLG
ncbi:MAG TPA: glycosyltransferase [Thermoanaerobaculia bacterium]|jgi:glycosyltransferase involved in cell wall biosynthesis|nr:glycosyltransferase [Thermoanaerobaculia bacterium]